MEIEIRKATHADLETLRTMEQGVIEAERPFDPTLREDSIQYYDLEGLLENPRALVLVATDEDAIVSCGYALEKQGKPYLKHETYAYLGFMFTEPEYRGNGLNGTILKNLKEWAQENGLTEIRLTVYDENSAALRAYEKVGFKKHIIEMRWPLSE
ncbi:MAG: RimJ/RimL family protein N-acetyltransferase [Maribacter sp.]|jgi:RimJ/RimL family protein N-acetyltransferase